MSFKKSSVRAALIALQRNKFRKVMLQVATVVVV
jgi:hypothetical protein